MLKAVEALEKAADDFKKDQEEFYVVTRVSKDDIRQAMREAKKWSPEVKKRIDKMNDVEMEILAGRMEDDYVSQLYWQHLPILFDAHFMKKK